MILRITLPGRGVYRIDTPGNDTTIHQVKVLLTSKAGITIPTNSFELCKMETMGSILPSNQTLTALGIQNGTKLTTVDKLDDVNFTPVELMKMPTTTTTPTSTIVEDIKPKNQKNEISNSETIVDTNSKAKVSHKSFESYIREHRFETGNLPLSSEIKTVFTSRSSSVKVPPSITLSRQKYRHVDYLEYMNSREISNFVNFWKDEYGASRVGWMYGYYLIDETYDKGIRAVLEGIYEPPQIVDNDSFILLDDHGYRENVVDKIAEGLNLELIGWIFTSSEIRDDVLITSHEIIDIAKLQMKNTKYNHYTKYPQSKFLTCVVHPKADNSGQPDTNVYMVSDQCQSFVSSNIILSVPSHPKYTECRPPVTESEVLPQILESGKEKTIFENDWFLVRVNDGAPKKQKSIFTHCQFPRENRPNSTQTAGDVMAYLLSISDNSSNSSSILNDFHLLIYLSSLFDLSTVLTICRQIREGLDLDPAFLEILNSLH